MPWPQDAYVGQKVVCVDDSLQRSFIDTLKQGTVYTIKSIGLTEKGNVGIRLNEIVNNSRPGLICEHTGKPTIDGFWCCSRFRPVQSTSTGYAILAKLQNPSNHRVRISEDA